MEGISQSELDEFRQLLIQRKDELEKVKAIGEQSAETVELDQSRVGRLSRMDAMQAQAMSQETNRRRKIELQRITAAFARLENGDYGFCVSCEDEIIRERLLLNPATPICVECAKKF